MILVSDEYADKILKKGVIMEEKERYTIESFEIEEPPVIFDNKTQQIILTLVDYNYDEITHLKDLLNHYFKRIKELESEVKVGEFWHSAYQGKQLDYDMVYAELRKTMDENQQLKEENGYIVFVDGYDENGNEIHRQEFVKYKDKFKELVEENKQLKERISIKMEELHIAYCGIEEVKTKNGNLKAEIQQLKQSQKQFAINELLKLRKQFFDKFIFPTFDVLRPIMDEQIKKLMGEID